LGLTRRQTDSYFDQIIDFSGIEEFIDTQVKFYSSGMYVRLAFAVAVHVDPEILLVDEVLAVGDEPFQRKCLERIKDFQRDGRTIVFVTHGLDMVRQLCDRVLLLEHGRVIVDGTPVEATREFRERYTEQEDAERPPPDNGTGQEEVRLLSTTVVDGAGQPARRFAPGEELNIDFEVESRSRQDDWVVGFAITNQVDTLVYGANTTMLKVDLPPIDGRVRVRIGFDELPLVEGQYTVSAVVHPDGGAIWHRQDRGADFRVYSPVGEQGVVHMRPQVSVLEPARPAALEVTGR
jgi:ABC-2 type transport system ATP-binding protein